MTDHEPPAVAANPAPTSLQKRTFEHSDDELVEKADEIITAMCAGDRWRMSIPVNRFDSDILLSSLVMRFQELRAECAALRATLFSISAIRDKTPRDSAMIRQALAYESICDAIDAAKLA